MAKKLPPEVLEFFRKHGRKGGKIGGVLRMESLTPAERSELGKKAVAAREAKREASRKAARKRAKQTKAAGARVKGGS